MVNVQDLKQRFKVANVAGVGQCIVIPMGEFDPAWDEELLQQGIECHAREDGYVNVVLGPETAASKNSGGARSTPNWSSNEEERLLKRMSELTGPTEERFVRLASEFPGRTPDALRIKYHKLRRAGKATHEKKKIRGRSKGTPEWTKEDEERLLKRINELSGPLNQKFSILVSEFSGRTAIGLEGKYKKLVRAVEKKEKVAPKPAVKPSAPSYTPPSTPDENLLVGLLKEIRDLLKPKEFYFDYTCQECNYVGSADGEERIWRFCPVCGKPLIVWNVEASS